MTTTAQRTYTADDVVQLLTAIAGVAEFRPGADPAELIERLATIRVAAKSIAARISGPLAESQNWVQFNTDYLRAEAARFSKGGTR